MPTKKPPAEPVAKAPPTKKPSAEPVAKTPPTKKPPAEPVAKTPTTKKPSAEPVAKTPPTKKPSAEPVAKTPPTKKPSAEPVAKTPAKPKPDQEQPASSKAPPPPPSKESQKLAVYFNDGVRRIDYILVWEEALTTTGETRSDQAKAAYRQKFEENLMGSGVEIERETSISTKKRIHYLKLFVTWETMCYYAEYLGFKAPLQLFNNPTPVTNDWIGKPRRHTGADLLNPLEQNVPNKPRQFYTCAFSASKLGKYLGSDDQDSYFKPTQRFEVAYEVLGTQVYGKKDKSEVGLDRMIKAGIYSCAFPPHDGRYEIPKDFQTAHLTSRQILHAYWAKWKQWYKYQPLDHIREYFGEKIAFYFAFLGYYTSWLVPASILGILVFAYSCLIVDNSEAVNEACNSGQSFKMCPLCDDEKSEACGYWYLSEICTYIRAAYLFDNEGTVLYSVFVSFWACSFLEHWKRKSAALAYQWDVIDFVEIQERPRPEYTAQCTEYEEDPITGNLEPHFPSKRRVPRIVIGVVSLMIMMLLSASCLVIMLISRAFIVSSLFENDLFRSRALTLANVSSALINLVLVLLLELLYEKLAFWITEWEMHRTQTEFENKVILKVFIFEFFNYYVSISYTALIKGNIAGSPGGYNMLFGMRFAQCINGSCMFELTQVLAVIIIGKQLAVNFIELLLPKLLTRLHHCVMGLESEGQVKQKQWESDYMLIPYDQGLFMEYLEVILQFGFITLFVPAFPLAPFFAMLNNLVEIRLDARKLVFVNRRPLPERAQGIGVWYSMLKFIVYLSTLSNALLMSFTSEFLPTVVYRIVYEAELKGYKNFTLSWAPLNTTSQPCRYNNILSVDNGFSEFFWKLLCARLIFALVYQQIVVTVSSVINRLIPDMPQDLILKIKRQKYLAKQALLDVELQNKQQKQKGNKRAAGFSA